MAKSRRKRTPKTVLKLPDLEHSKSAVLNSLTSSSSKRSYDHAIREFIDWYCWEPRLAGFPAIECRSCRGLAWHSPLTAPQCAAHGCCGFYAAGRGFGNTRTGAETIRWWVETNAARSYGLIAPIAAQVRDVMVEGESGLLNVFPLHRRPEYEPSKCKITFHTGSQSLLFIFASNIPRSG